MKIWKESIKRTSSLARNVVSLRIPVVKPVPSVLAKGKQALLGGFSLNVSVPIVNHLLRYHSGELPKVEVNFALGNVPMDTLLHSQVKTLSDGGVAQQVAGVVLVGGQLGNGQQLELVANANNVD